MFKINYYRAAIVAALFAMSAVLASAQTAPVHGIVKIQKSDGTTVPAADAVVDAYRTDLSRGSFPSSKTSKKGDFNFVGFPLGQTFALAISGAGLSPKIEPNVKAGRDDIVIIVSEGDGRKLTEAEVRQAIASMGNQPAGGLTEEQKKAQADYEKQKAAVDAKNSEIQNKNAVIQKAVQAGNEAVKAKDYDTAIARYTEGINADPEYIGSAPILLTNRGLVLKMRGVDEYNVGIKSADAAAKAAAMEKAKKDLQDSLDSLTKAWAVIKNAPAAETQGLTNLEKMKYDALSNLVEVYRLIVVTKSDPSKAADSKEAFDAYTAIETDPAKKAKAQLTYADIMRETGDSEKAIAGYRIVLQGTPDNAEAMAGLGLSLFNAGVVSDNKEQKQEGLNYMTKYIETSPITATDSPSTKEFKQSVKDAVDYLKSTEKLAPQKVATPAKRKG